jgi:uncharacterized membrane protein
VWIAANLGVLHVPAFDPYAFGLLTTNVSLEAIFLSTCVLVSQNRQAVIAERRSELDLQINLLTEYDVTRIVMLVDRLAKERNIDTCDGTELEELEQDIKAQAVLAELEHRAKPTRNNVDLPKQTR